MEPVLKEEPEESDIFSPEEAEAAQSLYSASCWSQKDEHDASRWSQKDEHDASCWSQKDEHDASCWSQKDEHDASCWSQKDEHDASFRPDVDMQEQDSGDSALYSSDMKEEEESAPYSPQQEESAPYSPQQEDSAPYSPEATGLWLQTGLSAPGASPSSGFPCPVCQERLGARQELTEHLTRHTHGRPPRCLVCGTQMQNTGDVRRHMMTHSGEKPFCCERCGKRFTRRHALHNHQMNCRHDNRLPGPAPEEQGSFCCCVCNLSFPTRAILTAHMVVHVGGDPPRCQVCTRKVRPQISNVLRHMMLHSGEKPFSCKGCSKGFSRKCSLKQHLQVCEEAKEPQEAVPEEEETFSCSVCSHKAGSPSLLTDHMTNHVVISDACGTCLVCHKTIQKSKNDVRRHMMIHSGEKPYSCDGCGKSFNRNSTLQVHMNICSIAVPPQKPSPAREAEEEDEEEGTFGCSLCEKEFFRKGLLTDHLTTHVSEPPGTCLICFKNVGTKRNDVRRHMMIHSGEKPFSCQACGMKFNRKFTLRHHAKLCTQGGPQGAPLSDDGAPTEEGALEQSVEEREDELDEEIRARCRFCNESFYEPSQLTEHMAAHTDDITGACLICGKALGRTVAEVRQHMMVHSGEKPFSCKVCGRRFIRTLALKTHMKTHKQHGSEEGSVSKPLHACSVCGQAFKTMTVLKYHMFIHSGVRPFGCSVCGKRFRQQGDVRRHMMLHSGEKPFTCRACGRGFARRNALRLHLRTHIAGGVVDEALLDEPPDGTDGGLSPVIVCDGCGQGFTRSLHFNRHLSTCGELHLRTPDTPFSCSFCAEAFSNKQALIEHVVTHKDGEYVSCAICNKSLRRGDLKTHLALHAGEKRHICQICGKGFSRNTHLRGHLRTHTKHLPPEHPEPEHPEPGHPEALPQDLSLRPPSSALSPSAPLGPPVAPLGPPVAALGPPVAALAPPAPLDAWQEPAESLSCHFCGKAYAKKSSLVSHIAENHKQPSSFKCPVCAKFLRRKSDLKRHLLTHSDDKPFQCRLCGKGFSRSDQLKGHLSAHHRPDELPAPGPGATHPQSHSCPDCMFPCNSYTCPNSGQKLIDCPSCQRSFSV